MTRAEYAMHAYKSDLSLLVLLADEDRPVKDLRKRLEPDV